MLLSFIYNCKWDKLFVRGLEKPLVSLHFLPKFLNSVMRNAFPMIIFIFSGTVLVIFFFFYIFSTFFALNFSSDYFIIHLMTFWAVILPPNLLNAFLLVWISYIFISKAFMYIFGCYKFRPYISWEGSTSFILLWAWSVWR